LAYELNKIRIKSNKGLAELADDFQIGRLCYRLMCFGFALLRLERTNY